MKTSNRERTGRVPGFTLIEILVATAVLSLLMVLTVEILHNTNAAIRTADRQMDAATQAVSVLDRFEADFTNAMLGQGNAALFLAGDTDEPPAMGFLSRSRAREADSGSPAWRGDLRGAVVAYRMVDSQLARGTSRLTYYEEDASAQASGDLASVYSDLADALQHGGSTLLWTDLGSGVVRFHVSFQLDNGEMVQTPPEYTMVSPLTGASVGFLNGLSVSPCIALATSAREAPVSGTMAGRHVSAVIVSVASLDLATLNQSSDHLEQLDELGAPGQGSSPASDTALALWESNLGRISFLPLRQNLRFFQRVIPVP